MICCGTLLFDLFDLVVVQADTKRTLNGLHRYYERARTLHPNQNPFNAAKGTAFYAHTLPNTQEGMVLYRNSTQKDGSDGFDLFIGNPGAGGVLANKTDYAGGAQNAHSVGCQIANSDEGVPRKQRKLDFGAAITPLPH